MNDLISMNQQKEVGNLKALNDSLINDFIAFIDATPKTVRSYSIDLRQFFNFLQDNGIQQPVRADVIAFKKALEVAGKKPTTIQNYIIAVRQFFKWTDSAGIYPNIAINVKGAKLNGGFKKDPLTSKQAKHLLNSIERDTLTGKRDYAIISLLLTTGLRTIELNRALIADIRPVADDIVLYVQGKGRTEKTEYVKLSDHVQQAINDYLSARGVSNSKAPLFTSTGNRGQGRSLTTTSISRIVKTRLRAINLDSDRLTAHSLRHTAGTLNLLNGGSLEETQQLLRHKNVQTTLIYAHNLERAKNDSEQRITDAIFD